MLEVRCLRKEFKQTNGVLVALDDVSIEFPEIGLVALCGENGCGKTTLLNAISSVDLDYGGEILLDGKDVKTFLSDYRRNDISYVFQEEKFVNYLNVKDNLLLFSEKESEEEVEEKLSEYGIKEKIYEYGSCLSGGQRQRASLIRGCIKKSRIILVDEPTSSLNEEMEKFVFETLKSYAKEKLVIFVSHNKAMVQAYADYIIDMDKARIVEIYKNDVAEIEYEEKGVYLPNENCRMNLLDNSKIKAMLSKYGEFFVRIKAKESATTNASSMVSKNIRAESKLMSTNLLKRIVTKGVRYNIAHIVGMWILIGIFTTLLCWLLSLANYDKPRFIYESLVENVDGYITHDYNGDVAEYYDNNEPFSINKIYEMQEKFASNVILAENLEYSLPLDFYAGEVYSSFLEGLALCKNEDITIILGSYSVGSQYMLTDFLADSLIIATKEYDSYEDILNKGFNVQGQILEISGIIDTDYEKYKENYYNGLQESQEYIDYSQNVLYRYARIYQSYEQYFMSSTYLLESYDYSGYGIKIVANDNYVKENGLAINTKFSEVNNVQIGGEIKLQSGYYVVDDVVNDNNKEMIIYTSSETLEEMKNIKMQNIEHISIELSSIEEVEYLYTNRMLSNSSVSGYINDTLYIINVLEMLFIGLIIILSIIVAILLAVMVNKIVNRDRYLIAQMLMTGYSQKTWIKLVLIKFISIACIGVIINFVMTILGVFAMNKFASFVCQMSIRILQLDWYFALISVAEGAITVGYGIWNFAREKKRNIIKCLEETK